MSWMETDVEAERRQFVRDCARRAWTMSALCARYGISRPTGYKWWARYQAEGEAGLFDRSRAPQRCPGHTPAALEAEIVAARRRYGWGARKLRAVLVTRAPAIAWPAPSTFTAILDRHQLLEKRRRRIPRWRVVPAPAVQTQRPNQVWPADFKGQFKTGDGRYIYPLTITDHFSRRILAIDGLAAISGRATQATFRRVFREVGLPEAIRTDNGAPFASLALQGLSTLSIWWMQLGIVHQRIRRGRPQDNGTHERMHRELKRETARPAAENHRRQQARFDRFRHRYNVERPHEALGQARPADRWIPSCRSYPSRIAPPDYPAAWEVRRVSSAGTIKWFGARVFVSQALSGQDLGFEEVDDDVWTVTYYRTVLGVLETRRSQIVEAGRLDTV
jgi:transposase InsO family protein